MAEVAPHDFLRHQGWWEVVRVAVRSSYPHILTSWLYVPFGIFCVLLACWGIDRLIGLSTVSFPASVALLILLFFGLMVSQATLGDKKTKDVLRVVEVTGGFALRYINVFFTPSFVLLPLSPAISSVEVGLIITVFLIGFIFMLSTTAYLVRGLQLLLGTTKRALVERADETELDSEYIPLTERDRNEPPNSNRVDMEDMNILPALPSPTQIPLHVRDAYGGIARLNQEAMQDAPLRIIQRQDPIPLTQSQQWTAWITLHSSALAYSTIFLLAGVPIYFATGYAMPIQLSLSVLSYLAALGVPPNWKRFLHPVLVSSALTILGIWLLALCKHETLQVGLRNYSTGTKYLQLWNGKGVPMPGAGDVFGSILDVSIVALALPMFQYRKELQRHFLSIVVPNVAISIASLFGYPALCYALGISSKRSLSFAARSLTLALATPATMNLGGDLNLVAVLCIMSGILGVLIGPLLLKWLRIPEDDYVTRGVTLGSNSSAIATALLLVSDPRAAALSSLSMGLFGAVMVALTSAPPIVRTVLSLVDL